MPQTEQAIAELAVDEQGAGSPTPSSFQSDESQTQEIANRPDVQDAFALAFGGAGGESEAPAATRRPGTTRSSRMKDQERADELEGLDANEADDRYLLEGNDPSPVASDRTLAGRTEQDSRGVVGDEEGGEPTLNPVLRQAARRAQWTDDDIDGLYKENPDLAEQTFKRLLQMTNDISAQYGRLGQITGSPQPIQQMPQGTPMPYGIQAPQQQYARQPMQPSQQQQPYPQDVLSSIYGQEHLQSLTSEFGQDVIDKLIQPLAEKLLTPVQQLQAHYQEQRTQAMSETLGSFFQGLHPQLQQLYGSKTNVSEEQYEARFQLTNIADQIYAGAAAQGLTLSVGECLERASLLHANEHLAAVERNRLAKEVQRRSKQTTQRPSGRPRGLQPQEKSEDAAMQAYAEAAQDIGLDIR